MCLRSPTGIHIPVHLCGRHHFLADIKRQLGQCFECNDLGDARFILGLELKYTANGISISQQSYIERILERFGVSDSRSVATPLDPNTPLRKSEPGTELADISEYQRIIGSLIYAVTGTRPDLAHTVTLLSQFSSAPNQVHLQAAKRVLRYLRGTTHWDLHYPMGPDPAPSDFSTIPTHPTPAISMTAGLSRDMSHG